MLTLTIAKISHFRNMSIPDDPTKTREIGIIHKNDSAVIAAPNQLTFFRFKVFFAKHAIRHIKNVNENGT
jgi:hypothetical protein